MGRAMKIPRKNWPDPCLDCHILLSIERDLKPSEVVSCVPKVAWIKGHSPGIQK